MMVRSTPSCAVRSLDPELARPTLHVPIRLPRILRRLLVAGLFASAMLLAASPADGDIAVVGVSPTVGTPGQFVDLGIGCGGGCGRRIPVSLVPSARAPKDYSCGANMNILCAPSAREPPRERPYVLLGWAKKKGAPSSPVQYYRLRFRVPRVGSGIYAFVIYCGGCSSGAGGSLIADTSDPDRLLRVRSEQNPIASKGMRTDAPWLIATAAGMVAIAAVAVFLRRRRAG